MYVSEGKGVKNDFNSWTSDFNNQVIFFFNRGKSEKDQGRIWGRGGMEVSRVSLGGKYNTWSEGTLIVNVQSIL